MLPFLTILMTPGPYAIARAEAVAKSVVTTTTALGAYRGAGRPEATAALERAIDLFAAEIGLDPADVRRRNLLPPFTEPHRTAFGALYDTGDYAAALDKALAAAGYDELRKRAGRAPRPRRRGRARDRPGQLRRDHRHGRRRGHPAGGERHRRGPSRRDRDDPHRHLPARPGARDRVGDAGQRGARHPRRQDHAEVGRHRPGARGRRHRRLAQPAARRLRGAAGRPGADRGGQGARRATSSRPAPRTCSTTSSAARSRWPATRTPRSRWPGWPRRSGCWCAPCSRSRARRSRSGRTWRSSTWTPRPAR